MSDLLRWVCRTVVIILRLESVSEKPQGLIETKLAVLLPLSDSVWLGWSWWFACLTSSQMILFPLDRGNYLNTSWKCQPHSLQASEIVIYQELDQLCLPDGNWFGHRKEALILRTYVGKERIAPSYYFPSEAQICVKKGDINRPGQWLTYRQIASPIPEFLQLECSYLYLGISFFLRWLTILILVCPGLRGFLVQNLEFWVNLDTIHPISPLV